ncbi:MAG: hypothetical protein Q8P11_01100 [bacterium]|nr:hypothetical protein [bacterium]
MKLLMLNIDPMTNNKLSVNERGILSVLPLFLNALKIKKAYLNEWIFRDDRQTYPDEDSSRVISWLADMLVCLTQNIKTLSEETHITVLAHDDDILDMKYISPELHAWLSSTYMGQILVYQLSLREQFQNIK